MQKRIQINIDNGQTIIENSERLLFDLAEKGSFNSSLVKFDEAMKQTIEMASAAYKNEETISREKYNHLKGGVQFNDKIYTITDLIEESNVSSQWLESEWGFPKGRRNHKETDYDCAIREFSEETGCNPKLLENIQNIIPYEEIFTGSNYKSYKHKYFVMYMSHTNSLCENKFERTEVSKMEWKSYEECISSIRHYNVEKKRTLSKIYHCLSENVII